MSILLESILSLPDGLNTNKNVTFGGNLTVTGTTTIGNISLVDLTVTGNTVIGNAVTDTLTVTGATSITSSSASALAVGLNGATNPSFVVDSATGSQAAGLKVTGATAAGVVAVAVISSGADASVTLNAKGTGTIGIGSVSTGAVTITPATTISGAATHSSTTALVGVTTVTATAGVVSTVAGATGSFIQTGSGNVAAVAAGAAIPLTNYYSKLDSNAGATTQTLAASTVVGLQKKIQMVVDGGDDVVTVTSLSGGTIITFADVGDVAELIWTGSAWMPLALYNVADGSTGPVIS
jgi:peptidoglycan DL-endopeptidase CwlO